MLIIIRTIVYKSLTSNITEAIIYFSGFDTSKPDLILFQILINLPNISSAFVLIIVYE